MSSSTDNGAGVDREREPRIEQAMRRIDEVHARDPERLRAGSSVLPRELDYARRMSRWVARLDPDAGPALRLAARAQHLARWRLPRGQFPAGRGGYLRWRRAAKEAHAELVSSILRGCDVEEALTARVASLVRKEELGHETEVQALEDAACLTFVESQLAEFARGRGEDEMQRILSKTWKKMSPAARQMALGLELPEALRQPLAAAVAEVAASEVGAA